MINTETRDDVVITYEEIIPEDKQLAEFYVYSQDFEDYAKLEYQDRTLFICRNGDMRISIPAEDLENPGQWIEHDINVNRYSDELERFAKNDFELGQLIDLWQERGIWIVDSNPWWEIYDADGWFDYEVFGDFYEAVDYAVKLIKDESFWTEEHNPYIEIGLDETPADLV